MMLGIEYFGFSGRYYCECKTVLCGAAGMTFGGEGRGRNNIKVRKVIGIIFLMEINTYGWCITIWGNFVGFLIGGTF